MQPTKVTAEQVKRTLDADQPVAFLDVRSEDDWIHATRKLPGALRVPPDRVADYFNVIPHDRLVVTYCSCPVEATSTRVASLLQEKGWTQAHPLLGGFAGWRDAGYPVEPK